jgi:uracil-DNA glycosylase
VNECRKCEEFGLVFQRDYKPEEFIEGSATAKVWVIGLNPAIDPAPEVSALSEYFADSRMLHPYFRNFAAVSMRLFEGFGKSDGTAHTDLVKCSSKAWPPPGISSTARRSIIRNCESYLVTQIQKYCPAMIVCNGTEVSAALKRALPPPSDTPAHATSYFVQIRDRQICVVLSGFIGRIDNYAKRRLGREIEARLAELGL